MEMEIFPNTGVWYGYGRVGVGDTKKWTRTEGI